MTDTHLESMNLSSDCFIKLNQKKKDCRNCEKLCQYCKNTEHIAKVCLNIDKSRSMQMTELDVSVNTDKISENT